MDANHADGEHLDSESEDWLPSADQAFLLDYFLENRTSLGLLPKEGVTPFALKSLLPSLLLLERDPLNGWRFTLVGTAVASGYGYDFTGDLLSEISYSPCKGVYTKMIDTASRMRRPAVCFGTLHYPRRNFLKTVKSIYPVTNDGETVTHCLLLLSIVQKTHEVELLYSPHAPTRGEDRLYLIDGNGVDGAWPIRGYADIVYQSDSSGQRTPVH